MWAGMELGQKITVWGLAVMLACGAAYIALASPTLSAVSQSGGASLGDLGATRVRESVWLTLASAAGTSLMVLAITDRHEQAARRSIAGVGSSVSLIACIAWAGLSLASSEAELAAVWWASSVLFGVVAVATSVAIVVVGLRVAQRFMRGWHDGEQEDTRMRVEGLVDVAVEWLLAVFVILSVLAVVAAYRRPSLHVSRTDMTGKTAIITESCTGRGFLHAQTLAAWGAAVVVTCDTAAEAERSAKRIRDVTGNSDVRGLPLDLGAVDSVRKLLCPYCLRVHTHKHTHTHTHARTHARARTHTHTHR